MKSIAVWFRIVMIGCLFSSCSGSDPAGVSSDPSPVDPRVEALLEQMTLDEKIGQMTQADQAYVRNKEDIRRYGLGSVFSGGDRGPEDEAARGWAEMYERFQTLALGSRLGIPLLRGVDAVHGHNNVIGAVIFPHNIGLGCTRDPALVEEAARITAREVAATGIDWTFAPCVAVPRDERWGRTYEGFGETSELAEAMGSAAVRGFQGMHPGTPERIVACAKHYLGDGGTLDGKDRGDVQLSEEELRRIHLPGYLAAIEAGVGTVMASYNSWNGEKLHGHRFLLTDLLKGELGFRGFVVSDWQGIDELPGSYTDQVAAALNAGIDMVMVPDRYMLFLNTARSLVEQGVIPVSRIDDAVRRILRVKIEWGLFENPYGEPELLPEVGSAEHREVARACVRRSLVLLKNQGNMLPLNKSARRIHVAGRSADDLGNQCGGWSITWQGRSGEITEGTTILEGIRDTVSPTTEVTFSLYGDGAEGADAGIVVVGELPYAEWSGDRSDLGLSIPDLLTINRMKNAGIPLVLVLVSGRPLIIEPVMGAFDAVLAAWLPGTEGQGVADVLFGDHGPTGKLSHSWPRDMSQIPVNIGDPDGDPLFPYGHGLSYAPRTEETPGSIAGIGDPLPSLPLQR